jgi:dihydrofolate reductase
MRKVIAAAFISVDGVMQAPGGPQEDPTGGFRFGGWNVPHFDEVVGQAMGEMFSDPFDLLLGRKTYDIFAAHWPKAAEQGDPTGEHFNGINKYVASRNRDIRLDWVNSHWLGADPVAAIRRLKSEDGRNIMTQGSSDFVQTLFANDLADEIYTLVFPVLLGKGKRFFGDTVQPGGLKLISSVASPSGVTISRYARDGEVRTGSWALEEPTEAELERRKNLG